MSDRFRYRIDYDGSFEQQIREGNANPLCYLRIEVDGNDIKGAPEGEAYLDDFMRMHLVNLLDSLPNVRRGQREECHFYSHSNVLVLDPEDTDIYLAVTGPDETENVPEHQQFKIDICDFEQEVLSTAENFVERVIEINHSMAEEDSIQDLQKRIEDLKRSSEG